MVWFGRLIYSWYSLFFSEYQDFFFFFFFISSLWCFFSSFLSVYVSFCEPVPVLFAGCGGERGGGERRWRVLSGLHCGLHPGNCCFDTFFSRFPSPPSLPQIKEHPYTTRLSVCTLGMMAPGCMWRVSLSLTHSLSLSLSLVLLLSLFHSLSLSHLFYFSLPFSLSLSLSFSLSGADVQSR